MAASDPYSCEHVVPIEQEPRHHLVIANEYVRAFAVEIAPGDRTLCHHHPYDYLLYVATDAEIISAARGEEPKQLSYRDGECELSSAGLTHVVENLGDTPFRNIVVELLPAPSKLSRGARPSLTSGAAQLEQLLDEGSGAVFSMEIDPNGEIEIRGPAVVAAPYGPMMLKELDDFDIPLDEFQKQIWVCPPRKVALRNSGQAPARAIVFQIGQTSSSI